ncbi:hypothetical protein PVAP13_9KG214000 [Panicum virgatum]|uniref:Uncharacterized protein n=1 Tax=Panicum virgatum TaxID=38727 RepID=A0A8T0NP84_PANVG|nr:hypothetical protein PVAP13_9KG214000 [Panicum virgatum]
MEPIFCISLPEPVSRSLPCGASRAHTSVTEITSAARISVHPCPACELSSGSVMAMLLQQWKCRFALQQANLSAGTWRCQSGGTMMMKGSLGGRHGSGFREGVPSF